MTNTHVREETAIPYDFKGPEKALIGFATRYGVDIGLFWQNWTRE